MCKPYYAAKRRRLALVSRMDRRGRIFVVRTDAGLVFSSIAVFGGHFAVGLFLAIETGGQ